MADGVAGILLMLTGRVAQIRSTVGGMKILNRSRRMPVPKLATGIDWRGCDFGRLRGGARDDSGPASGAYRIIVW